MSTTMQLRERRMKELVQESLGTVEEIRLVRLTGGASRETLLVETGDHGTYILRIDGTTGADGASLDLESRALRSAEAAGVPVPSVHAVGRDEVVGSYMLMDHVAGETIARRILRDPMLATSGPGLARGLGDVLARIHAMNLTSSELAAREEDPLGGLLTFGGSDLASQSGLALGIRWLQDHPPEPGPTCVVHGDFRLGNLMIGTDGLRAVLDWELVHLGDPVEDLGWMCAKVWRFGAALPVGGLGTREDLLDGYAAVAGWRPSSEQLRWWELYATVRWGLMCGIQAGRHLSGADPSIELVAIGRRAAEQEFDVLLALGIEEPRTALAPVDPGAVPAVGPYGRPSIDDLVGGVLLHLESAVMPLGGRVGFHARVSANVIKTVRRQLQLEPAHRERHRRRLAGLELGDEADLSAAILSGDLDSRWDDVLEAVRGAVVDRLSVANPAHFAHPV